MLPAIINYYRNSRGNPLGFSGSLPWTHPRSLSYGSDYVAGSTPSAAGCASACDALPAGFHRLTASRSGLPETDVLATVRLTGSLRRRAGRSQPVARPSSRWPSRGTIWRSRSGRARATRRWRARLRSLPETSVREATLVRGRLLRLAVKRYVCTPLKWYSKS